MEGSTLFGACLGPLIEAQEQVNCLRQGEDARRTMALMEAKIRRLQGIIMRSQPQEEHHLRTIQSLEQVPALSPAHSLLWMLNAAELSIEKVCNVRQLTWLLQRQGKH